MINVIQTTGKYSAILECYSCKSKYEVKNRFDNAKSRIGHLCTLCKEDIKEITYDSLNKFFEYSETTGLVTAKVTNKNRNAGDIIGYSHSQGYITAYLNGREYLLHRLIWVMKTGIWPIQIDHINHNRSDNRWENLRDIQSRDNQLNSSLQKNSSSGVLGVRKLPYGSYQAYIMVNRKQINLGCYKTKEEASKAREVANIKYGFHVNHGK